MNSEQIIARFVLTPSQPTQQLGGNRKTRASAIMLPILDIQQQAHVLLCKRPNYLHHHPGEICLPGGKHDASDLTLRHTALREIKEELNIAAQRINIIGQLGQHSTLTGFTITPFIAILQPGTQWENDINEVQASFLVPIKHLCNEANWQYITVQRNGQNIHLPGFVTDHGLLWGATANIIRNFTRQINLKSYSR